MKNHQVSEQGVLGLLGIGKLQKIRSLGLLAFDLDKAIATNCQSNLQLFWNRIQQGKRDGKGSKPNP